MATGYHTGITFHWSHFRGWASLKFNTADTCRFFTELVISDKISRATANTSCFSANAAKGSPLSLLLFSVTVTRGSCDTTGVLGLLSVITLLRKLPLINSLSNLRRLFISPSSGKTDISRKRRSRPQRWIKKKYCITPPRTLIGFLPSHSTHVFS